MIAIDPEILSPEALLARVRRRLGRRADELTPAHELPDGERLAALSEAARALEGHAHVGVDHALRSHRPRLGPLIVALKRGVRQALRYLLEPPFARQTAFNTEAARALAEASAHAHAQAGRLAALEARVAEQDAAQAAFLDKLEALAAERGRSLFGEPKPLDYVAFEARFRGSPEAIQAHLAPLAGVFAGESGGGRPVLEIGCGRGEFLETLRERGCRVQGVDLSPEMVEESRKRGLPVAVGEALETLAGTEAGSLGGIAMIQVIEHMSPAAWRRFLELAHRALGPGGALLVETINPGSFYGLAQAFYKDLTHVWPVHPETLEFVCKSLGFETEILWRSTHPAVAEAGGRGDRLLTQLAETVFGHLDYALVARKP